MKATDLTLLVIAVMTSFAPLAHGQPQLELANGGFETFEATANGSPRTFGDWSGDYTTIRLFVPEAGISPRSGLGMLHFLSTGTGLPSSAGLGSELFQLVSLDPVRHLLTNGWTLVVTQSCYFNRVAGDAWTDTQFQCILWALDGLPATYPSRVNNALSDSRASLYSDADIMTWEELSVQLTIPSNATFIAAYINAAENVFNDAVFPEFDGHFADDVSLTVSINPPLPRLEIQLTPDQQALLSWPTYRGFIYQLLRSSSLDSPDWQPFGDPYFGDDFPAIVTGPPISESSQAYFRLRVSTAGP